MSTATLFRKLFVMLPLLLADTSGLPPQVVKIVARDYVFEVPDTVAPGLTIFDYQNVGTESHEAILVKVPAGHSASEVFDAFASGNGRPDWVEAAGGPNIIGEGVSAREMQWLQPGTYVWLCYLAAPDRMTHIAKGMARVMVVAGQTPKQQNEPVANAVLQLRDFDFALSQPLKAGVQWIRVENTGLKAHELVVFELPPGKTLADALAWRRASGEPRPFTQIGGVAPIMPGAHAFFEMKAHSGRYVLRCRITDRDSGRTHRELGMETEISIP